MKFAFTACLACLLALPVSAQLGSPSPGFQITPSSLDWPSVAANDERVSFNDGADLLVTDSVIRKYQTNGTNSLLYRFSDFPNLAPFPTTGILELSPDETYALASGIEVGGDLAYLVRIDIPTGGLTPIPIGFIPVSAVFEDADNLLLTTYTVVGITVGVFRFHLPTQTSTLLGSIGPPTMPILTNEPGAMVLDSQGNLYYARVGQDFNLRLLGDVLRFDHSLLGGAVPFTEAQATVLTTDYARDLSIDSDRDEIYACSPNHVRRFGVNSGTWETIHTNFALGGRYVEFVPGSAPGALGGFGPYQPEFTGILRVHFRSGFTLAWGDIQPLRPELSLVSSGSSVTRTITQGPPSGFAFLFSCPAVSLMTPEVGYAGVPGVLFDRPLFLGLDPATLMFRQGPHVLDANGTHGLVFPDPGLPQQHAAQVILFHPDLSLAGSSDVGFL